MKVDDVEQPDQGLQAKQTVLYTPLQLGSVSRLAPSSEIFVRPCDLWLKVNMFLVTRRTTTAMLKRSF